MLEHDPRPPFEVTGSELLARDGQLAFRKDRVRWPDGSEGSYRVFEGTNSVFMVPVHQDRTTVLVRQWRHSWGATAWEVPAGTLEAGEEPLAGAQRELEEEAGLIAEEWTPLGVTHGTALITGRQNLYLARRLSRVGRTPETYERDMLVRELPFQEALDAALAGEIAHAASISAIVRAARVLGVI